MLVRLLHLLLFILIMIHRVMVSVVNMNNVITLAGPNKWHTMLGCLGALVGVPGKIATFQETRQDREERRRTLLQALGRGHPNHHWSSSLGQLLQLPPRS